MLLVVALPPLAILRRGLPVLRPVLSLGDVILAITSCARRGPQCAAMMGKRALAAGTGRGGDQIDAVLWLWRIMVPVAVVSSSVWV